MLEIRAGTGGDEAALFAADLYRMYERYAAEQGWRVEMISANASDIGGFKEVVANISGQRRVRQAEVRKRRPPGAARAGDRKRRAHPHQRGDRRGAARTDEVDVQIEDKDLKIDVYRASGAGGQHVNTTDSAVRITHLPTGIVVTCRTAAASTRTRKRRCRCCARAVMKSERDEAQGAEAEARKAMVGSGDRSERIRTYNFPQGRVTDHRINLTLHKPARNPRRHRAWRTGRRADRRGPVRAAAFRCWNSMMAA
jgi:peptide chain release factor 1